MKTSKDKWLQCLCSSLSHQPEILNPLLETNNLPMGYCGRCTVCGQLGHTRPNPKELMQIGMWCDEHYQELWEKTEIEEYALGMPCYCTLWETNPEVLRKQNIPEGYCAKCLVCGQPGHTRANGASTGSWCDYHWIDKIRKRIEGS